jgi:hypothetical protein
MVAPARSPACTPAPPVLHVPHQPVPVCILAQGPTRCAVHDLISRRRGLTRRVSVPAPDSFPRGRGSAGVRSCETGPSPRGTGAQSPAAGASCFRDLRPRLARRIAVGDVGERTFGARGASGRGAETLRVTLTVHGKERDGEQFVFTEPGSLIFDRSQDALCRIRNDRYVSRHHFMLLISPSEICLRDLNSASGTKVDGRLCGGHPFPRRGATSGATTGARYSVAVLVDGSQIEGGCTRVTVSVETDQCDPTTPESARCRPPRDPRRLSLAGRLAPRT